MALPARGSRLRRSFFGRPCLEVARDLVGCVLVRRLPDGQSLALELVEVEAYLGDGSDPASHSHRGRSPRNRSMFGPPGRLYVYESYGIHRCANVVCEATGSGAAVLLRAGQPLLGESRMRRHRGLGAPAPSRLVASGPGRLAEALAVSIEDDGLSLLADELAVYAPHPSRAGAYEVATGPRVGITRAADLPYRFFLVGHPMVSPWRPGKPGRRR